MTGPEDFSLLRVLFAFAVVLGLMGCLGFVLKYLAARGLVLPTKMARTKRIKIIESQSIDGKRRFVIVRCDGREHLLLLGGQSDIVVETNLPPAPSPSENP